MSFPITCSLCPLEYLEKMSSVVLLRTQHWQPTFAETRDPEIPGLYRPAFVSCSATSRYRMQPRHVNVNFVSSSSTSSCHAGQLAFPLSFLYAFLLRQIYFRVYYS